MRCLKQDVPQFNFQYSGDSDQGVQRGFTLAPVQQADGRLVETAPVGEVGAANATHLPLFFQQVHDASANSGGLVV